MKTVRVSAPGKLHIIGEHAVVYGKPALLAAINRRCFAEITERKDNEIVISSQNTNTKMQITQDIILDRTLTAQNAWNTYQETHNVALLTSLIADPLNLAVIAIGETLLYFRKHLQKGFSLSLTCDIPIGSGMGSSAAMAVAVITSVAIFLDEAVDQDTINRIAFLVEQRIHGNPSGGDNSTCCFGGFLWFRRESTDLKIIHPLVLNLSDDFQKKLFILDSGKPLETTGEMVSSVRVLYGKKPAFVERIFSDQENLARSMVSALKIQDSEEVMGILKSSQRNLEELGVVSEKTIDIIRKIESIGGAAKISGAGGKKENSGIILAFHQDPILLTELAQKMSISSEPIILGVEGVKKE